MNRSFSIGEAIGYGWETAKKNWQFLVGLAIISMLPSAIVTIVEDAANNKEPIWQLELLSGIIGLFISVGIVKLTLRLFDGENPTVNEVFKYPKYIWNYFLASIIYGLIVMVGFFLLIIPGIIWAIKYQFAFYFLIDQDTGITESLEKSATLTKGIKWNLFLFNLALGGVMILGALVFGIGILVAIPVTWMAEVYVYRKLLKEADVELPVKEDKEVLEKA